MLKNFIKIAFRNLWRNKTYASINIFGLSIGVACAVLILLWVRDELSYDRFHSHANEIYRVLLERTNGRSSQTPAQLGPTVADEIPEIAAYTRVFKLPRLIIKNSANTFYEDEGIIVDPQFLTMFDFHLLEGDAETALISPVNIVITESMAKKYFGDEDPLNKIMVIDGKNEVQVSGVLKDISGQSHLRFDFLMPFSLLEILNPGDIQNWGALNYATYLRLHEGADVTATTEKINQTVEPRMPPQLLSFWERFTLQPLTEAHLSADVDNTHFLGSFTATEDKNTVYMFSLIAFFILGLACINFMNLSTARSGTRLREIGMKKVTGASRGNLVRQFLGEFFVISTIAFVLAMGIVELVLPWFNQISGKDLVVDYGNNLFLYALIILLTTLLGGFYPAIYLSSFNPIKILKGQVHRSPKASNTRSLLVVFQFAISIVLIASTIIVYEQIQYVHNKRLGFRKENIVYMHLGGDIGSQYQGMKDALLKHSGILGVTAKDCLPTEARRTLIDFFWDEKAPDQEVLMELTGVDYQYFEMLGIEFAEGRNFSKEFPTDATNAFILNEEAVRQTGMKSPVGKNFATYNKSGTIIGVIKDTNFKSLHQEVNPQVYHIMNNVRAETELNGVMLIKLKGPQQAGALSYIEDIWKAFNPNTPFEYHFLDQAYENLYLADRRTRTIINYFSFLAILIACLGLYGLAAFTAEKRKKEIGIRKTLGASIKTILAMFTNDFTKLVLLANILAWPVAWYAMHQWLQNFAYRIDLTFWPFFIAGVAALVIALVTISWQAVRAAKANPVESLRYE